MAEYIIISYITMLVWAIKLFILDGDELKSLFKWWLFSPVVLPANIVLVFIRW